MKKNFLLIYLKIYLVNYCRYNIEKLKKLEPLIKNYSFLNDLPPPLLVINLFFGGFKISESCTIEFEEEDLATD